MINKSFMGFIILLAMIILFGLGCFVLPVVGIVFLIIGIIKVIKYRKVKNENRT